MPDTITRGVAKNGERHTSRTLCLDYLPPYSPELNPIERVWKLTRRQCLHNRYFLVLEVVAVVETGKLAYRKRNPTPFMRNHLRRCV
jgi:transposase